MMCTALMFMTVITASDTSIGRAILVEGDVYVSSSQRASETDLAAGDTIAEGAILRTGEAGRVRFLMKDRSVLSLGSNTRMAFKSYRAKPNRRRRVNLRLLAGRVWSRVSSWFGNRTTFHVSTVNAVAGVRGTEFLVDYSAGKTQVTVFEGSVELSNRQGVRQLLGPLDRGSVSPSQSRAVERSRVNPHEVKQLARDTAPSMKVLDQHDSDTRLQGTRESAPAPEGTGPKGLRQGSEPTIDDVKKPKSLEPVPRAPEGSERDGTEGSTTPTKFSQSASLQSVDRVESDESPTKGTLATRDYSSDGTLSVTSTKDSNLTTIKPTSTWDGSRLDEATVTKVPVDESTTSYRIDDLSGPAFTENVTRDASGDLAALDAVIDASTISIFDGPQLDPVLDVGFVTPVDPGNATEIFPRELEYRTLNVLDPGVDILTRVRVDIEVRQ